MRVLAGDIGGTKTELCIAEVGAGAAGAARVEVLASERFASHEFSGLAEVARAFLARLPATLAGADHRPRAAGFGLAGPVREGRCQTTNLPWVIDERELSLDLGLQRVRLANDFAALAVGIAAVPPEGFASLQDGVADPQGHQAVIGAGTGLGEAICVAHAGGGREVIATEGGHATFSPRDPLETGVQRFLAERHGHVSWERVLSGDGLVSLVEAVASYYSLRPPERLATAIAADRTSAPALVTEAASAGEPVCARALQLFCSLYGAEAGNLALKSLPGGGVFVAGGIAPRILPELSDGRFREAFCAKGRMRPLLERIPVRVVLDARAALFGAALLAAG